MMPNAMSLKAKIKNLAKQTGTAPQALLQAFFFERFLERLSQSEYRDKFVVKGGMLISAMVGVAQRSTMDLDTTIRNLQCCLRACRKRSQTFALSPLMTA